MKARIAKIVSGGQTGADRGALDAALAHGVLHGGWCPRERRAEDGAIPPRYRLQETAAKEPIVRTEKNVLDADATLVFTVGVASGGTKRTVQFAARYGRPCLVIDLGEVSNEAATSRAVAWLGAEVLVGDLFTPAPDAVVLNVAGCRESRAPGIAVRVCAVVGRLLHAPAPAARE